MVYSTHEGGTVEAIRVGLEFELIYRTASGRTAATVRMSSDDALDLLNQLADAVGVNNPLYEEGYDDGYSDAEENR